MEQREGGCQICDTVTAPLICAKCVKQGLIGERWAGLDRLQKRKESLLARLNQLLAQKEQAQEQHRALLQAGHSKQAATQRYKEVEAFRLAVQAKAKASHTKNAEHTRQLDDGTLQLDKQQAGSQGREAMQDVLRARALQLRMLLDSQSTFTRLRVRSLLEVLPVSIPALRQPAAEAASPGLLFRQHSGPANQQAPYVTIRGLRLPDTLNPNIDNDAEAQKLGSALGYALLLTRVLAYYLHAPLLHCLVYQGSTSSLAPLPAQRDSVSVADDTSSTLAVLYIAGSTAMPAAASMVSGAANARSSIQSSIEHYRQRFGGLTLGNSTARPAAAAAAPASTAAVARGAAHGLPAGLHALARSLGALLAHAQSLAGARLPADWNPFACLAAICAQLVVDPRAEKRAARGSGTSLLLRSAILNGSLLPASALAQGFLLEGEDEDDVVDGWDMVQRPLGWGSSPGGLESSVSHSIMGNLHGHGLAKGHHNAASMLPLLPPTPSQSDDVQHWERAMFTDSTRPPLPSAVNGLAAYGPAAVVSPAAFEQRLTAAANMLAAAPSSLLPFRRGS